MSDARGREDAADPALAHTAADSGRDAARALRPGDRLGRYTVLEIMGEGGMGVVYAAHDPDLDRKVAIKLLRASSDAALARARLLREARAMARLRHPNVITVYEAGAVDDRVFVAMELVEGVTVAEWLAAPVLPAPPEQDRSAPMAGAGDPRDWRAVLDVFLAAGRGLAAAHAAALVHRDFKPGNILLDRDGRVVVTDFGLARQAQPGSPDGASATASTVDDDAASGGASATASTVPDAEPTAEPAAAPAPAREEREELDSASGNPSDRTLTRTGAVLGTPAYMAPEQHRGNQADARSDQFSFCVALYEGLYGQRPFQGHTAAALHAAIVQGHVVPAPRGTKVPKRLRRILLRGLSARPDDRFSSMRELLAALERVARRRSGAMLVAAAAALIGVAVLAVVLGTLPIAVPTRDCAASLDGAWDDEVATAVRAALAGTSEGSEVFTALAARLDAGRDTWLAARARICDSERQAPDRWAFHHRMGCLLDYRDQLAALTELVRAADAQAMDFALSAADGLPDPGQCAELVPGQQSRIDLVQEPERAAELERVRVTLAQAAAAFETAKLDRAIELADAALARARALGDRRLQASALYRLGSAYSLADDNPAARRHLREAILLAEELGAAELLADALVLHAAIDIPDPTIDVDATRDLIRRARGAVGRVREPGRLLGWLRLIEAYERSQHGDPAEANAAYADARQLYLDAGFPFKAARADLHWGLFLHRQGRLQEGNDKLERGLAVMRTQLSAMSYEVVCLLDLAYVAAERLERYDEARRFHDLMARRCPRSEPTGDGHGRDMRGRVVDGNGRSVSGVEVVAHAGVRGNGRYALRSPERRSAYVTRTDASGGFTLPGKILDQALVVVAESDGGRSFPVAVVPGAGAGPTLILRPYGSVRGRLAPPAAPAPAPAPAGAPANATANATASAGALAAGQAPIQAPIQSLILQPHAGALPYRSSIEVPVRGDGTFAVERLAAGRYRVALSRTEFGFQSMRSSHWLPLGEVEVMPGRSLDLPLALPADSVSEHDGSALEIHVHNRFDGPIPRAHLVVLPGRAVPASMAELETRWYAGATASYFAEAAPEPAHAGAGDADRVGVWYRFASLPPGDLVVCAVPLSERAMYQPELGYPAYLDVYCEAVLESERLRPQPVIIEAAPMRRRT